MKYIYNVIKKYNKIVWILNIMFVIYSVNKNKGNKNVKHK